MTLINGDKIITTQLYDDEYEEFIEEKMSIIDYVNAYTDEGVTTADDVLDKIRAEIEPTRKMYLEMNDIDWLNGCDYVLSVIDKYKAESEE